MKGTDMTRDHIQQALDTIYGKIFNQGQADLYPGMVSGPYVQHNPLFPNGLDAIVGYIKQAGRIPCEVKRVAIDGDLAFVHVRYLDWGGQETAGVDIFRFNSEGKVLEHWDVLQDEATGEESQSRCTASGPANNLSFVLKSNARSICKLGPPPKVQTERNLQNSRLNPDESGSPVDLGCRIPAKCAFFTQLMRESRKPEDSLAEQNGFELQGDFVNGQLVI